MPGASPAAAVDAFLDPLREALACIGVAHFTLSPGARGEVGRTHAWTLNRGEQALELGTGLNFRASMRFEILDQGQSSGRSRFRVTTREYIYSYRQGKREILGAHWHPIGSSRYLEPHYHVGGPAIADTGVYLERAHIPSHRVSFEEFIRLMISELKVPPRCSDWEDRLRRTESTFKEYKTW